MKKKNDKKKCMKQKRIPNPKLVATPNIVPTTANVSIKSPNHPKIPFRMIG